MSKILDNKNLEDDDDEEDDDYVPDEEESDVEDEVVDKKANKRKIDKKDQSGDELSSIDEDSNEIKTKKNEIEKPTEEEKRRLMKFGLIF